MCTGQLQERFGVSNSHPTLQCVFRRCLTPSASSSTLILYSTPAHSEHLAFSSRWPSHCCLFIAFLACLFTRIHNARNASSASKFAQVICTSTSLALLSPSRQRHRSYQKQECLWSWRHNSSVERSPDRRSSQSRGRGYYGRGRGTCFYSRRGNKASNET